MQEGRKEGEGVSMFFELHPELLAMVIGWIPTKELYPNCFLVNRIFLSALLNEVSWKQRCLVDLGVDQPLPSLSWIQTYKGEEKNN